ncbi:MAG: mechanosensitive ion channel [Burkholderiaceae bacterium]
MLQTFFLEHRTLLVIGFVILVVLARIVSIRLIRERNAILREPHRRLISAIRNISFSLIAATVLLAWLPEIQHFALSITAIALAIVIATKELTLCISGSIMTRGSSAFSIGDWIRSGEHFGEVIEENLLTTVLQQIDPLTYTNTGRTIIIPNSRFLTETVINQNFLKRYLFQTVTFTSTGNPWQPDWRERLMAQLHDMSGDFAETARRYNAMLEQRTGVDIPNAEPQIEFSTNQFGNLVTTITLFCPTDHLVSIEQRIIETLLAMQTAARPDVSPAG